MIGLLGLLPFCGTLEGFEYLIGRIKATFPKLLLLSRKGLN